LGSTPVDTILSIRPLVFLGKISFSMYLTHMCLLMSVALIVSRQAQKSGFSYSRSALIAFIVYVPVLILVATIFQRWVDAPAIRLSGRLVRPRVPRVLPAMAEADVTPRELTIKSA
jgi:peptidoglycan/LPS O-acetylase OafA/YrhL